MITLRKIYLIVIAALLLNNVPLAAATPQKLITIKIGIDLWPGYYPVVLGKHLGLFAEQGLDVHYFIPENTDTILKQFSSYQLDAVCVAAGDIFSLLNDHPGLKVSLIADLSAGGDALLSLQPLPSSLKGLRIGTNLGGFGELFVEQFLIDHHSSADEINLINIDASEANLLLQAKQLDIAHSWEPYVSHAQASGAKIVYTSRQTPGLIADVIVFQGDFIQQHPQAVKDFNTAWLQAVEWWQNNRDRGDKIIQKRLSLRQPVSLKGIKLMNTEDNHDAFHNQRSSRALPRVMQRYINFFYQKGTLHQLLKPEQILAPGFLPDNISPQASKPEKNDRRATGE